MSFSARRRWMHRVPVWAVLVALTAVPTLTLVAVGVREVRVRSATVAATDEIQELSSVYTALADIRAGLVDEQIYVSSALVQEQLGIPPELVAEVVGTDIAAERQAAGGRVDDAYRRALDGPVDHLMVDDTTSVSDVLQGYERHLETRSMIDDGTLDFAEVNVRYSEFRNDISSALASISRMLSDSAASLSDATRLRRLLTATRVSLDLAESQSLEVIALSSGLVDGLLKGGGESEEFEGTSVPGSMQLSADRRRIEVREIGALLDGPLLEKWEAIRSHPDVIAFEEAIEAAFDGGIAGAGLDATATARQGLGRLRLHTGIVPDLGQAVWDEANRLGEKAQHRRSLSLLFIGFIACATVGMATAASIGITRPLGRLHDRAVALRDGDLDAAPTAPGGPAEVFDVGHTFHDIVDSLRNVERRARAMIEGRPAPADEDLPGPLGRSVQQSIQRLAEVTERLQVSEALSNAIVATAAEAIWTLWEDGRIRTANSTAQELTGLPVGRMVGQPFESLLDRSDPDAVLPVGGIWEVRGLEASIRRPTGEVVPVLLSAARVDLEGEALYTVFARDITERKQFESRLEEHARTDPLTLLPNRRAAVDAISHTIAQAARTGDEVAVVFCDLDGFKQANDTYGHAFGDRLLRQAADRFQSVIRTNEVLARLGGDEFVVVMSSANLPREAMHLSRRLLSCLEAPFEEPEGEARLSGSIGIAWGGGDADALDLLRNADIAMYRAKAKGGACFQLYDGDLEEEARVRVDIERGLRRAIEQDELLLHFQPIIDAHTQSIIGAEALVRWDRPGEGLIPPGRFIPVAEDSGALIVELGRWVLAAAARQIATWDELGLHEGLPVSVNIAGTHLTRYDIVGDVQQAFAAAGADPSRLRIELTETQLITELEAAAGALRSLADIGVTVAIDDYGTGYSSITYLRRLPVSAIKIDRSFIVQLHQPNLRAIVESLVTLASVLGLEVVAEGVEHPDQLEAVAQLGCTALQGYLIGKPMPAEDFDRWAATHLGRPIPPATEAGGAIIRH